MIGAHFIRVVAIAVAFTATLYPQQPAPQIVCSDVLSLKFCDLGLLQRDAFRSAPQPPDADFENRWFNYFHYWSSYNKQNELAPGRLWASPFKPRQDGGSDCCGWDLGKYRSVDCLVSKENNGTLCSPGLAGACLWPQSQPSLPERQSTQSSAGQGSAKHIFWLVPAFHVSYLRQFKPLTPREKFDEWLQGTYDPQGLSLYALESATLEHSSHDGFCGYGKGWGADSNDGDG
jgi:hypothetical protein